MALIKPSTRAFFRAGWVSRDVTLFDLLHGYVYARWPYLYIAMATGEHPLARRCRPLVEWFGRRLVGERRPGPNRPGRTFADTYHGKVVPLEGARSLVRIEEEICIDDLEQVIPYQRARAIIMKNPERIAVMTCPCRQARDRPCAPLDVCLIVGDPFASFIVEHHPDRARLITREEAERILEEEDARGHVHHAFFKDAMLGRFYAICNCCSCCCGAMQAHRSGTPMLASSGYMAMVKRNRCTGCGLCADLCPFGAISVGGDLASVRPDRCMGCGICVGHCPAGALSLWRNPARGVPLEIMQLTERISCSG